MHSATERRCPTSPVPSTAGKSVLSLTSCRACYCGGAEPAAARTCPTLWYNRHVPGGDGNRYDFGGRVALVTGGASGIGLAVGRLLAASGARVAVLDRDGALAEDAAQALEGLAVEADVTRSAEVDA